MDAQQIEYEPISHERQRAGWQGFALHINREYHIQSGLLAVGEQPTRESDGWTTKPVFPISDADVADDDEPSDTSGEEIFKDKAGKRLWLRAILALLGNASHAQAAKEAGISCRQLSRWKATPEFQKLYLETKGQVFRESVEGMKGVLTAAGIKGAKALQEIAEDKAASDTARVAAARALTSLALEINDLETLAADIAALKAARE